MLAEGRLYLLNATARNQYKRDHPENEQLLKVGSLEKICALASLKFSIFVEEKDASPGLGGGEWRWVEKSRAPVLDGPVRQAHLHVFGQDDAHVTQAESSLCIVTPNSFSAPARGRLERSRFAARIYLKKSSAGRKRDVVVIVWCARARRRALAQLSLSRTIAARSVKVASGGCNPTWLRGNGACSLTVAESPPGSNHTFGNANTIRGLVLEIDSRIPRRRSVIHSRLCALERDVRVATFS